MIEYILYFQVIPTGSNLVLTEIAMPSEDMYYLRSVLFFRLHDGSFVIATTMDEASATGTSTKLSPNTVQVSVEMRLYTPSVYSAPLGHELDIMNDYLQPYAEGFLKGRREHSSLKTAQLHELPKFKAYDIVVAAEDINLADSDEIDLYSFAENVLQTWKPPVNMLAIPQNTPLVLVEPAWDDLLEDFVYLVHELPPNGQPVMTPEARLFAIATVKQLVLSKACDGRLAHPSQMVFESPFANASDDDEDDPTWTVIINLLPDQSPLMYNVIPLFLHENTVEVAIFINGFPSNDNLLLDVAVNFSDIGNLDLYTSAPVDVRVNQETRTLTIYLDNNIQLDYERCRWKARRLRESKRDKLNAQRRQD